MKHVGGIGVMLVVAAMVPGCQQATEEALESAIERPVAKQGGQGDVRLDDDSLAIELFAAPWSHNRRAGSQRSSSDPMQKPA